MKRQSLTVIPLAFMLLACSPLVFPFSTPTQTQPFHGSDPTTQALDIAWDDRSLFRAGLTPEYSDVLNELPGASIYHIVIKIADPPTRVTGMEEVRYTNQETIPLTEVDFAVYPELLGGSISIQNAALDGQPVAVSHHNGLMRFPLDTPLQPGDQIIIHLDFEITVPERGGDFYYGIFGYNDGILSLAQAYPTILVYNDQGWNSQTPDLDGDPLFSDASFYLVSVDAPADLVLAASGTEVSRTDIKDRQQVLYADGPARDFYLAASRGFIIKSEMAGGVMINSYSLAGMEDAASSARGYAKAAIGDFSRRYAGYPYTEFDIVPILTSAAGVEFPGLTSVAVSVYNSPAFLEIVVVHEVAHQWYYNLVGDSTQGQPWLDESMTEFLTWQYFLDRYGAEKAQTYADEMRSTWGILDNEVIPIGLPVSAYTSSGYVAIVYGRGPLFLLTLRDRMGLDVFDRFMVDYTKQYEWSIATTDGFKKLAEQTCNCDLTSLFDTWVYP